VNCRRLARTAVFLPLAIKRTSSAGFLRSTRRQVPRLQASPVHRTLTPPPGNHRLRLHAAGQNPPRPRTRPTPSVSTVSDGAADRPPAATATAPRQSAGAAPGRRSHHGTNPRQGPGPPPAPGKRPAAIAVHLLASGHSLHLVATAAAPATATVAAPSHPTARRDGPGTTGPMHRVAAPPQGRTTTLRDVDGMPIVDGRPTADRADGHQTRKVGPAPPPPHPAAPAPPPTRSRSPLTTTPRPSDSAYVKP
jgi:hypothetical protein